MRGNTRRFSAAILVLVGRRMQLSGRLIVESHPQARPARRFRSHHLYVAICICCIGQVGCRSMGDRIIRATTFASPGFVQVKEISPKKSYPFYKRFVQSAPRPSERTELLLRKYNLESQYDANPDAVVEWFQQLAQSRPTMNEVHALAEIAKIQASWSALTGDDERASRLYATAVVHSYQFLFDSKLNIARNAYDPQFRNICDVYNSSLESLLRMVFEEEGPTTGQTIAIGEGAQGIEFVIEIDGRWKDQIFERFELVNDFQADGLANHYHTYGLGVPLIAVREQQKLQSEFEKYYPPEITVPMPAFMHLLPAANEAIEGRDDRGYLPKPEQLAMRRAVLKLYDPLEQTLVQTESKMVPLESDITTPLAYGLRDPLINKGVLATASLLNAEFAPESYGLFMLEPYDPTKIPVVMVHGLWSSPATWVHMFNDLRANRDIHENCQFWFYSYPTGQPFWISAQQMRADLEKIRREVDPGGDSKPLDQMVLVGHSMGGLISKMQTVDSEDLFWKVLSDDPIESLKGDRATINLLRDTFYFKPNQAIDRVVTLATPSRGSDFSNPVTQWVSKKLFTLPSVVTNDFTGVVMENKDKLKDSASAFLTTTTSIGSLSPSNPLFEALEQAKKARTVKTHNIVGQLSRKSFLRSSSKPKKLAGDGVVSIQSAMIESAESQIFVNAEHSEVHQHPGSIFEVRRILLEHLAENNRVRLREIPELPMAREAELIPMTTQDPITLRR